MKKLISAILLFALAVPVFAQELPEVQEPKWTVRASVGYIPSLPTLVSVFGGIFVGAAISMDKNANETLDIIIPPYLGVDAMYNFNSRWSVGLSTGYTGTIWNTVDKDTREIHSSQQMVFVPLNVVGRYNYLSRPNLKLYGSLEAGALFIKGSEFDINANVQVNPFGVEFGKKFFGMAEVGVGINYAGGRIGVGYRF